MMCYKLLISFRFSILLYHSPFVTEANVLRFMMPTFKVTHVSQLPSKYVNSACIQFRPDLDAAVQLASVHECQKVEHRRWRQRHQSQRESFTHNREEQSFSLSALIVEGSRYQRDRLIETPELEQPLPACQSSANLRSTKWISELLSDVHVLMKRESSDEKMKMCVLRQLGELRMWA